MGKRHTSGNIAANHRRKARTYVQERNEDGDFVKVMHGVKIIPLQESANIALPQECPDWLEYIRLQSKRAPWRCGYCLCANPKIGTANLIGVLVRDKDELDERIFATHLCPDCAKRFRNDGEYFVTNAYLIPIGLPIAWHPKAKKE